MLCAWRKLGSVSGDSRIHSFASLPRLLAYTNTGFKAYDYAELAALTFQSVAPRPKGSRAARRAKAKLPPRDLPVITLLGFRVF